MTNIILQREMRVLIKESVREALHDEMIKYRSLFVPFVSIKEQRDIEKRYKKPSRKFVRKTVFEL